MKEGEFEFPMMTATGRSIKLRKLVYGKGVNDAQYLVNPIVGVRCPYYQRWCDMLKRSYCPLFKVKRVTYIDVAVCEDWLTFSNFRAWMEKQDWEDKYLDKDIISPVNKVYSPETCAFVSNRVNCLLLDCGRSKGKWRQGVCFDKKSGKFRAQCNNGSGKQKKLGTFPTEQLAYEAYVTYKHALILKVASEQEDERVKNGLLLHANILLQSLNEENETLL